MVKAVRVHEAGGPEVLKYEDVELADPGPGEVRIKHVAIGINYIDTYYRTGLYAPPSKPFIVGNEAAGTVIGLGKGASGFKEGDRVAYVAGLRSYAEEANVPEKAVVKLPKSISFDTAAGMMLKGMTAEYLVRRSRYSAVMPFSIMPAAVSKSMDFGSFITCFSGTFAASA